MLEEPHDLDQLQAVLGELRAINNLINRICQVRETNHIMQIVIDELVRLTDADQGLINLVTPTEPGELVTVVRKNEGVAEGLPYKVNTLISGRVLRERTMVKIDDLDHDDRFRGLSSENGRFRSIMCCPMVVRGEIVGLTSLVRSAAKGPFEDRHSRLVGILTSQSAHILKNARLLEDLAAKNELLEVSRRKLREENIRLQSEVGATFGFENIICRSPAMKRVLTLTSKFSNNDSPVLITGETGTGKELIARAIHYNSPRKNRPLVVKNCGVKTESLLESELFGHVKGAFTGADREKIGLFEEADGGTIFLDEIGDAPLSTQAAILRVIQYGEIRLVGAGGTCQVNVRVLSATNKNLKDEIAKSNFREDLFYRLNTLSIDLPPLRERKEDIPLLVNHFLRVLKVKLGRERLSISPAALEALVNYAWPGNVRQLEHEIERAAVVCDPAETIEAGDLSSELIGSAREDAEPELTGGKLRAAVEKVERDLIVSTLAEYKGNILQTSKVLGLTRKGLKDKMGRYGIDAGES